MGGCLPQTLLLSNLFPGAVLAAASEQKWAFLLLHAWGSAVPQKLEPQVPSNCFWGCGGPAQQVPSWPSLLIVRSGYTSKDFPGPSSL